MTAHFYEDTNNYGCFYSRGSPLPSCVTGASLIPCREFGHLSQKLKYSPFQHFQTYAPSGNPPAAWSSRSCTEPQALPADQLSMMQSLVRTVPYISVLPYRFCRVSPGELFRGIYPKSLVFNHCILSHGLHTQICLFKTCWW